MEFKIILIFATLAATTFGAVPDAARGKPKISDCKKVAFSAVTNSGSKAKNLPITYQYTLLDKGTGYDARSGIFTTYCPGLYQFSFSGSGNVKLSMKRRPSDATSAWTTVVETGPTGGSQTILLSTQVDEQVAVFVDSGTPISSLNLSFTAYKLSDA